MGATAYLIGQFLPARDRDRAALVLLAAVFAACLFGIATRPVGFLANIWPANAIMLALLLRLPAAGRSPLGWIAGAAAFVVADLLTGASLAKALLLNGTNLVGIAAAYAVYARLPSDMVRLERPASMLCLVLASAAGAAVAGVAGSVVNPILFGGTATVGWTFWFATEFVNYVAILPVLLSAPPIHDMARCAARMKGRLVSTDLLPILALVTSCALATTLGGPGAMAIPVPALLWCGLAYPVFATALLTLLFGLWTLTVTTSGYLAGGDGSQDEMLLVSVRLGASLVSIAPVMVSCIAQSRNELLARLHHMASHDQLTGLSNRHSFMDRARHIYNDGRDPVTVMMLDLDHFKQVNDGFGHAAGDAVLRRFAETVTRCLRAGDIFARMGGEEFAILAPRCRGDEAERIADRITNAMRKAPVELDDGQSIAVTVSIGIVCAEPARKGSLDAILARADIALYHAKRNGRDRWEQAVFSPAQTG